MLAHATAAAGQLGATAPPGALVDTPAQLSATLGLRGGGLGVAILLSLLDGLDPAGLPDLACGPAFPAMLLLPSLLVLVLARECVIRASKQLLMWGQVDSRSQHCCCRVPASCVRASCRSSMACRISTT